MSEQEKINLPKRKKIRLEGYDYSKRGKYFVTICLANRKNILWEDVNVGAATCRPPVISLSYVGKIVDSAIKQISNHYDNVDVDKYCIMPDHIHMIVTIHPNKASENNNGRMISAPTLQTIIGQMKRWVSKQLGYSIWQKSFIDRIIRNEKGYQEAWEYITNNPLKLIYEIKQGK